MNGAIKPRCYPKAERATTVLFLNRRHVRNRAIEPIGQRLHIGIDEMNRSIADDARAEWHPIDKITGSFQAEIIPVPSGDTNVEQAVRQSLAPRPRSIVVHDD